MPTGSTPLNDNRRIPNIAFGTGSSWHGKDVTDAVTTALEVGFRHIDTAQQYVNEENVGTAIKEWLSDDKISDVDGALGNITVGKPQVDYHSGKYKRKDLWVTTKYGGGDRGPLEELKLSLEKVLIATDKMNVILLSYRQLHLGYVDLYLIHHPRFVHGDVKGVWRGFERAKELGLAK